MRPQCDYDWVPTSNIEEVQQPRPRNNYFVPGPRGAKRITSQASRQAGWEEKQLISASAESLPSHLIGKRRRKKQHTNVWVQTCPQAYLVQFCQRFFIVKFVKNSLFFLILYFLKKLQTKITKRIFVQVLLFNKNIINCLCQLPRVHRNYSWTDLPIF